jgi:hypothetical protein
MHANISRNRRRIDALESLVAFEQGEIDIGGAFVGVKDFGAIGNGVTDDSAAFQRAVNALSGTGITLWIPKGNYYIASTLSIPLNASFKLWADQSALIIANLPTGSFTNSIFLSIPSGPSATTTVSANVGTGDATSNVVTLTSVAGLVVGQYLELQNAAATNRAACYLIKGINAVTKVVTVDRPILLPFIIGDNAFGLAAVPQGIELYFNGATLTGSCNRYIEISFARDCIVDSALMRGDLGYSGAQTACMSYDIGCYRCFGKRLRGDATSMGSSGTSMFLLESNEASAYIDCKAVNGSGYGNGFEFQDCVNCYFRDCDASLCIVGAAFEADGNTLGSIGCQIIGGHYDNNITDGIQFDAGSSNCKVIGATCNNTSAGNGVFLTGSGTMTGNELIGVDAMNCYLHGIINGATALQTKMSDINVSGSGTQNGTFGLNLLAPDTTVDGLTCVDTVQQDRVQVDISASGGVATVRRVTVNMNPGAASIHAFYVIGGRLDLEGGTIQIGHSDIGVFLDAGGKANIDRVTISPSVSSSGEIGVYLNSTNTVRLGSGFNASACAVAFENGGTGFFNRFTQVLAGAASTVVAWPDLRTSDNVELQIQAVGGTLEAPYSITPNPGTGFTITPLGATPHLDTSTLQVLIT